MPSVSVAVTSALCRAADLPPAANSQATPAPTSGRKIVASSKVDMQLSIRLGRLAPQHQRPDQHQQPQHHRQGVKLHHAGLQRPQHRAARAGTAPTKFTRPSIT